MGNATQDTGKIARSAGKVSIAVMCSRVLGLVREQVFAALFGAGFAYDAFVVAFRIPNLLRDLFGEGALSAAFVTVFTDYDTNKEPAATWKLANNVLTFIAILLSFITLAGMFCADSILAVLAPDFALIADKMELTRNMTVIMFPFLIFISLSSVVMGILNSKGHFFVPAMASSFFNLGSIVGGLSLAFIMPRFGQPPIVGMAFGTLVGGLLQLSIQFPSLQKAGFSFRPHLHLNDPGLRRVLFLMVPAIIGLSATQVNIFINTYFAAACSQGSVSWLSYAFRLVHLPVGLFGVALSVASLPVIARHAASGDMDSLKEAYATSLTMAFCLTVPATVGLLFLAEPIIRVIFEHGAFTSDDTSMTAQALIYYSLGLFAYAAVKITVPVFYALHDTRYPVMGSFLAVAANIVIILLTIDAFQHRAIALSTSCAMTINFLFLFVILYRKIAGYPLAAIAAGLVKILLASGIMGGFLLVAKRATASFAAGGLLQDMTVVLLLVAGGTAVYGISLAVLGLREMNLIVDKLKGLLSHGVGR